jgi:hypothetical protein
MALVTHIEAGSAVSGRLHDTIDNARSFYFAKDGNTIFQIDTSGRDTRKIPGKKSQTIQLNRNAARELIFQLREAFPGILD